MTIADEIEWAEHKLTDNTYKYVDLFSTLDGTKYIIWSDSNVDSMRITKLSW